MPIKKNIYNRVGKVENFSLEKLIKTAWLISVLTFLRKLAVKTLKICFFVQFLGKKLTKTCIFLTKSKHFWSEALKKAKTKTVMASNLKLLRFEDG